MTLTFTKKSKPLQPMPDTLDMLSARIKSRMETCLIETGEDLLKAKSMLAHGEFQPWLKTNFGWSLSQAQNLMNVAKNPENAKFVKLPKAAQYALAAPSTPEAAKDKVIAEIAAGKKPSLKEVQAAIAEAKPSKAVAPKPAAKQAPAPAPVVLKPTPIVDPDKVAVAKEKFVKNLKAAFKPEDCWRLGSWAETAGWAELAEMLGVPEYGG